MYLDICMYKHIPIYVYLSRSSGEEDDSNGKHLKSIYVNHHLLHQQQQQQHQRPLP